MSKIRIFAFPSHGTKDRTSGVDWARIIQPMTHLGKEKGFEVYIYDPVRDEKMDWIWVAKNFDIIYMNYTALPWAFAAMGAFARKYNRKIILDLDDDIWNLSQDNPAYIAYKPGSEGLRNFTAICNEVDEMTTTNLYLKHVITHNTNKTHDKVTVFPNYVDFKMYNHKCKFKDTNEIVLLHHGSTTHFQDLENEAFAEGVDKIMKEFPNVVFKTVGSLFPKYKYRWGQRYINAYGDGDIYKWIKDKFPGFMDETDILVVPLVENIYNRAKSSIKFIETSSAGIPGCWQKIRQYNEIVVNGVNGFLCETSEEWYKAIKRLILEKDYRKRMGKEAYLTTKEGWQIQDKVKDYANFFKRLDNK